MIKEKVFKVLYICCCVSIYLNILFPCLKMADIIKRIYTSCIFFNKIYNRALYKYSVLNNVVKKSTVYQL